MNCLMFATKNISWPRPKVLIKLMEGLTEMLDLQWMHQWSLTILMLVKHNGGSHSSELRVFFNRTIDPQTLTYEAVGIFVFCLSRSASPSIPWLHLHWICSLPFAIWKQSKLSFLPWEPTFFIRASLLRNHPTKTFLVGIHVFCTAKLLGRRREAYEDLGLILYPCWKNLGQYFHVIHKACLLLAQFLPRPNQVI